MTKLSEELAEKRLLYQTLKQEGHAVQLTAVDNNQGRLVSVHLAHYLTCVKCLEKARGIKTSEGDYRHSGQLV